MYCRNCGKELLAGAEFCMHCGIQQEKINSIHRKTGKKTIVIVLIAIIIISLVSIGIWYYEEHKTQIMFYSVFDSFMSKYSNVLQTTNETLNKVQKINANMSVEERSLDKPVKIKAEAELDARNRKSNINYDLLYNDISKIKGYLYINDNSNFFNITSSEFTKTIKLPEEWNIGEYIELTNLDSRVNFVNKIGKVIKNNLKKEYFSSEKVEIDSYEYDGEIMAIKNSLSLSGNDIAEILENIRNDISKDKELEKALDETLAYMEKIDDGDLTTVRRNLFPRYFLGNNDRK